MKLFLVLGLLAVAYASPLAKVSDRSCDSEICRALAETNANLPGYLDQLQTKVCGYIPQEQLKKICLTLFDTYKPQVLEILKQQLQQEATILNCDLGNPALYVARDDCSSSQYCQTLKQVYDNIPTYIDQLEGKMCDSLPDVLQKVCHTFVQTYKGKVVDALQQALKQQAAPAGCVFDAPVTTEAPATTALPTTTIAGALVKLQGKGCDSEICRALAETYNNLPTYLDQLEAKVCGYIPQEQLKKLCVTLMDSYKPKVLEFLKQQLQQEATVLNCDLSSPALYVARDDCSSSQYCQTLKQVYESLPDYINQLEEKLCGALPDVLQKVCHTFVQIYKGQVVDALQQALQQQAAPAGCVLDAPVTTGVPPTTTAAPLTTTVA